MRGKTCWRRHAHCEHAEHYSGDEAHIEIDTNVLWAYTRLARHSLERKCGTRT